MSPFRLIRANLKHHVRMHLAVAFGVMAATAVLTGALLVGDSVRGSLRELALDRLGTIDEVLLSDQFFRAELAAELASSDTFADHYTAAVPVCLLRGTVEKPDSNAPARTNQVTLIGSDEAFWTLGPGRPEKLPAADEIVLNAPLADDLGAQVGDELLVRIPLESDVPSESPLGKKTETLRSQRLRVVAIIPAEGLGRFGLSPSQQLPRNAYLTLATVQQVLDEPGMVNAVLIAGQAGRGPAPPAASAALEAALQPQPIDYGLSIERIRIGEANPPVNDYFNLTGRQMMLPQAVVSAAQQAWGTDGLQPAFTYLANTIRHGNHKIPYSTVTGLQSTAQLGPLYDEQGQPLELADDEIILNGWAAEDLGAKIGDQIGLTYYEPVSTHGELTEPAPALFRLRAIVSLEADSDAPTKARDPHFTPELKGVTDQASIDDWDLPFELVEKVRDEDEQYWDDYRTTPKAFISLAAARRLWGSRFGDTTSLRIPYQEGMTAESVFAALALDPAQMGLVLQPVKQQALQAAAGTTPFNLLFLGFSFFIIAAAVMLTALLFRLGIELRASEVGLLAAVGLPRGQVARMYLIEGAIVSTLGALVGVLVGVGYAWLMLAGLRTWWLAAVSTPFLQLHMTPESLVIGLISGLIVALATILWSLRKMVKLPVRRLLSGQASEAAGVSAVRTTWSRRIAAGLFVLALVVGLSALNLSGDAQAGAFFGSGFLVLASLLLLVWSSFHQQPSTSRGQTSFGLAGLALRNGARNPGRSTLTIGLVAAASFLIVAISAFRLESTEAGTGGFTLVADSDQPILQDLNTEQGRYDLAFNTAEDTLLAGCQTYSFRVRSGDDASCLNLYRPRQPRLLGVTPSFVERGGFAWAGSAAETSEEQNNPWRLLDKPTASGAVPVVIDMNTAMYSLHLWNGVGETYTIDDGQGGTITLEIVGLLKNSMLQGELLISEANFLEYFPQTAGYRFFLVDVPGDLATENNQPPAEAVSQALEATLGDWGFDATRASERLESFLAVQNTYLSTFQSLGALGLLLGTFGLATVQLRNVFERRGELALMRAAGFRLRTLARLVLLENGLLLLAGLGIGVLSALVAVLPHMFLGGASVPWQSLAVMLGTVLIVGLAAGSAAVRATLRAPLIAALRGD